MADPPPSMTPSVDEAVLSKVRAHLAQHHWIAVHVPQDSMLHTLGLTSYGLPELVVLGQNDARLATDLEHWACRSVAGELELGPTVTLHDRALREHTVPTRPYDPATRGGLWLARALFGSRLVAREIDLRGCRCPPCRSPRPGNGV